MISMTDEFGIRFWSYEAAEGYWQSTTSSIARVVLVTIADRFERLVSFATSRLYRFFNCKVLHNAVYVPADRAHLGWNPKFLKGIIQSDGFE